MHGLRSCDVEAHNPESQEKRDDDEMAKDYGKGDTKHEEVEEMVEKETEGDGNTNVAITKDSYEKKKHAEIATPTGLTMGKAFSFFCPVTDGHLQPRYQRSHWPDESTDPPRIAPDFTPFLSARQAPTFSHTNVHRSFPSTNQGAFPDGHVNYQITGLFFHGKIQHEQLQS